MKKKILIVEAGIEYQKCHLIEATKQLPYEFYLLQTRFFEGSNAWVENWFQPCRIIRVDSMEPHAIYEQVLEYLSENKICFDGIMTFWEGFVPITHYLQMQFKLPLICKGEIRCLRHKGMMRDCVGKSLMKQPNYHILKSGDRVEDVLREYKYPLIVKPAEMAASLAVTKVCNDDELTKAIALARSIDYPGYTCSYRKGFNLSDDVLVEEYVHCDYEISVEGAIYHGELNIVAICQKLSQPEPFFWEYGEITPSPNIDDVMLQKIRKELQSAIECLHLYNCMIHAEIRVSNGNLYFIEVGARIGGFPIPEIVSFSIRINLLSLAVPISCNERPLCSKDMKVALYAGDYNFNTIHTPNVNGMASLSKKRNIIIQIPGVKDVSVRANIEDTVYGDVIAVASSGDELLKCFEKAREILN